MIKKYLYLCLMILCAVSADAAVSIQEAGGWFESAYVTWTKTPGMTYNVYVRPSGGTWTLLDDELVREYPSYGRADALGLSAGNYQFKVVPVQNGTEVTTDAAESSTVEVKAHDRSGFAHQQAGSEGIGAYNNDGTLKENARVLYVWADNAKTVSLDVVKNNKGQTDTYTGLQNIIYGYQKGDGNGSYEKRPLCIRIIGTIKADDMDSFGSSSEGLQIKGAKAYMPMNITIEGVGNDANISGFGFLIRNTSKIELRNFGVMLCMDDAISIDTNNSMIWIHNLDLFYGNAGSDPDQAKGDGTIDLKGDSQYLTISYNHLYDSGKASLCGMKSESGPNWITYHHNWFDHSDSRHPRIRTMSVHVYNNYFDGNAKYGVGAAYESNAFVENNYFRNCKYPMLISKQGSDVYDGGGYAGKGTFSGENGGMIKSFGNHIQGAKRLVTYQQENTQFDCWEAASRNDQVPATVKAVLGGKTYSNFDTDNSIMYSYTPDAATDIPTIVKGQYGAGRMQHGDFKWTFNNSTQDENYAVISELKSALQSYRSTLMGFFAGETISNGGATNTVNDGDGKGLTEEQQDSYVPSWAGGGGGTVSAGLPDPNFCGAESEPGKKDYDYLWFNTDNKTKIEGFIADELLTYTGEGSSFNDTRELKGTDGTASRYTGSLQIATGANVTFKCLNGVSSVSAAVFRTGGATGEIQASKDGTSFTKIAGYEGKKGDITISATTNDYATGPAYVRITNGATGSLHITGIKIMYPDPNAQPGDDDDWTDDGGGTETPDQSSDATAEFTADGTDLSFKNYASTIALPFNDSRTSVSVSVTPAEGASISSVSGATASGNSYTITAPAAGGSVTASFTITAEDGTSNTYTITVTRGEDTPIETGAVTLQSDNVSAGYMLDGSANVTAYTYSSDLCKDAKLIKVNAAQHTVTLPYNAKVTKIVMYAVGDNNTANKGKITELAGQTFAIDLPSRKSGTSLATATVENVEITGSFTFTVSYAAGVKFALTVESIGGTEPTPGPGEGQQDGTETAFIADGTAQAGFNYYWFNADNEEQVNTWLTDGTITLTDGTSKDGNGVDSGTPAKSSFKKDAQPTIDAGKETEQKSEKIGTIEIAKTWKKGEGDGGTATFYCPKGIETFKLYMFRTGTYNFHVFKSTDGDSYSEIAKDETTTKGKLEVDYSSLLKSTQPVWVKIQNTSTGGLNIQGIIITYMNTDDKPTPTAIDAIRTVGQADAVYYDLTGRRVATPKTGKVYIVNERKVLNK